MSSVFRCVFLSCLSGKLRLFFIQKRLGRHSTEVLSYRLEIKLYNKARNVRDRSTTYVIYTAIMNNRCDGLL